MIREKAKGQSTMDNAEILTTFGTKNTGRGQTNHKNTSKSRP